MSDLAAVLGLSGLVVAGAVVLAVVLAPFESLAWWAGWFGRRDEFGHDMVAAREVPAAGERPGYFLVYLSGIGTMTGDRLSRAEQRFLAALADALPPGAAVSFVFPYSAEGRSLTSQRFAAWFWRFLYRHRHGRGRPLTAFVFARNLLQVLVSADSRYGPVFNYGVSRQVLKALLHAGYDPGQRRPVFLLGYSGGGQIAVGASTYLKGTLAAPVEVITLGGVISADPGLTHMDHLTRIYGTIDSVQSLGERVLPPRWPSHLHPRWRAAHRAGTVDAIAIGRIRHLGERNYLDSRTVLEQGDTPQQRSVSTISDVVTRRLAVHTKRSEPPRVGESDESDTRYP